MRDRVNKQGDSSDRSCVGTMKSAPSRANAQPRERLGGRRPCGAIVNRVLNALAKELRLAGHLRVRGLFALLLFMVFPSLSLSAWYQFICYCIPVCCEAYSVLCGYGKMMCTKALSFHQRKSDDGHTCEGTPDKHPHDEKREWVLRLP